MTAPTAITSQGRKGMPTAAVGPLPTRQRRPGYVALAVALMVACATAGGWMYLQAGQKTPVVVVVREVPAGHVIETEDLSTVDVAGAVTAIAGENLDSVVGQSAAVTLLPDMLLQRSMVTTASPIGQGEAQVGVAVRGGQVPADGVAAGDTVTALQVPSTAAGGPGAGDEADPARVLAEDARVHSTRQDPAQAGGWLVTLIVPRAAVPDVAAAAGAGQIALAKVPPP